MPIVIRELDPKTGKPKPKAKKKKNPPQVAKGGGMMKKKGMRRGGMMKSKGMAAGGKLKMVEKDGKKVPFFAADGKGEMAAGGRMKKKATGSKLERQPGGSFGKPKAPSKRGMGMKKGGMMKKGYAKGGAVKVKSGDTLSQIAKSKGLTLKSLMAANPGIKNANEIRVGQSIKMPTGRTKTRSQIAFQDVDKNLNRRDNVYAGMTKSSMKALADDTTAKRAKKVVASSGGKKRIRRRKGADLPEQANKRARVTTRLNQLGEINKQRRAADADKKPRKAKRSRPAIPSNDIAAKKGGAMKKKGYAMGGMMKKKGMARGGMMRKKGMSKGGVMRGTGAATKGKRFGRAG